jgi:hypothetical protein
MWSSGLVSSHKTIQWYDKKEHIPHFHCHKNLKSHIDRIFVTQIFIAFTTKNKQNNFTNTYICGSG